MAEPRHFRIYYVPEKGFTSQGWKIGETRPGSKVILDGWPYTFPTPGAALQTLAVTVDTTPDSIVIWIDKT